MKLFKKKGTSRCKRLAKVHKSFQDLPLEMLVEIFSYLPPVESIILRSECRLFRLAVAVQCKDELRNIILDIRRRTGEVKERTVALVKQFQIIHPALRKSLQSWLSLKSDLYFLHSMVWRYGNDMHSWCKLSGYLVPIMSEVRTEIDHLVNNEWKINIKKPTHHKLGDFMKKYTNEFEVHFFQSERLVPFELKLIDVLFCCPHSNIQMLVTQTKGNVLQLEVFFEVKVTNGNIENPKMYDKQNREEKEREILRYMRECLRKMSSTFNRKYINQIEQYDKIFDGPYTDQDIKNIAEYIMTGDEFFINHTKRMLKNKAAQDVYEALSTINVEKTGLYCEFGIEYMPEKSSLSDFRNAESGITSFQNSNCFACKQQKAMKYFNLAIYNEKKRTDFVKEVRVFYDVPSDSYSYSSCKHFYA